MKRILLPLLVILNPYSGLQYEEPTLYQIQEESPLEIVVTLGDGYEKDQPDTSSTTEVYISPYLTFPHHFINFPSY